MAKKFEELTISDDFMFGIIMRDPRYCKPFLERVLSISIDHIEYPKIQETIDIDVEAKSIRLDVYVDDGNNTVYNIEMQNSNNKNLPMRMRYYQDVIDLNLLDKGQNYDELKTNLVIFVCTFDPFGLGRHFYSFENICIEDHDLSLNDGTKKIMLNTKGILDDISPDLKRLLDFIDGAKPADDFTRDLDSAVKNARLSTKWRVEYMNLQLAYQEKYREGLKEADLCRYTLAYHQNRSLICPAVCDIPPPSVRASHRLRSDHYQQSSTGRADRHFLSVFSYRCMHLQQ